MVVVNLTNGFGNNLFQYNAARLLANYHHDDIFAIPPSKDYYAISGLKHLGVDFSRKPFSGGTISIGDNNFKSALTPDLSGNNFLLNGYFEDYTIFYDQMPKIKTWFPIAKKRGNSDLVIHFRAGDRLFYKNEFDTRPTVESYLKAIDKFDFENMHIVSDMPNWDYVTCDELKNMEFHYSVPSNQRVEIQRSSDYFNSFIDGFKKYNPVFEKRTTVEDFQFMRTFENILFQHGTLGWWAAALSDASRVGVYGPWRPWKGAMNKNLSQVKFDGWFQWD